MPPLRRFALLATLALTMASASTAGEDPVDACIAGLRPGTTKAAVDAALAAASGGAWVSRSSSHGPDGASSSDLVVVSPWDHLVLTYATTHDPSGNGNLDVRDALLAVRRHRFAELMGDRPPEAVGLLTAIQGVGVMDGGRFDPAALVACANRLRALGEERAVAALADYLALLAIAPDSDIAALRAHHRHCWAHGLDEQRVILVAHALFEPRPGGVLPAPALGAPGPGPRWDPQAAPVFPLLIHHDLPFLPIYGYALAGQAESAAAHLPRCRERGTFRAVDLAPTPTPLAAVEDLVVSDRWRRHFASAPDESVAVRTLLREQALACLPPGIPAVDALRAAPRSCCGDPAQAEADWQRLLADPALGRVRWDPAAGRYVLVDER